MNLSDVHGKSRDSASLLTPPDAKRESFARWAGERDLSGEAFKQLLRSVLERGMPFRFQASGSSMTPFIRNGDVVTVAPLDGQAPRRGDIVAFLQPNTGKIVVHRLVGREGAGTWVFKGDSLQQLERGIPGANLLGTVTRVERCGKPVRGGLGPERLLIPWLTCHPRMLARLLRLWRRARRIVKRGAA